MGLVEEIETEYRKEDVPDFSSGDTVEVHVLIREGGAERIQRFEGYVISRKGEGLGETFTVRKIVQGEGVERTFPIHTPRVDKIEVLQTGRVGRSKLYYLSEQKGKSGRIQQDTQGGGGREEPAESPGEEADETQAADEDSAQDTETEPTEEMEDASDEPEEAADEQDNEDHNEERDEEAENDTDEEERASDA